MCASLTRSNLNPEFTCAFCGSTGPHRREFSGTEETLELYWVCKGCGYRLGPLGAPQLNAEQRQAEMKLAVWRQQFLLAIEQYLSNIERQEVTADCEAE